jgi:hypothetical protein
MLTQQRRYVTESFTLSGIIFCCCNAQAHPRPIRIVLYLELTCLHPTRLQYKDRIHEFASNTKSLELMCLCPISDAQFKKL